MKIYEHQGPVKLQGESKKLRPSGEPEKDFQKVIEQMKEAGKMTNSSAKVDAALRPAVLNRINGVEIVQPANYVPNKANLIDALKESLDLLDFYADKLADGSLPADGMQPLVDHLDERLTTLMRMEVDPGLPEKLKPIVSDLGLAIGKEVAKFKRGDYF